MIHGHSDPPGDQNTRQRIKNGHEKPRQQFYDILQERESMSFMKTVGSRPVKFFFQGGIFIGTLQSLESALLFPDRRAS